MWLENPDAFWLNDLKVFILFACFSFVSYAHNCDAAASNFRPQPLTDRGRCTVAEELGCSDSKVALVDNATQGWREFLSYLFFISRNWHSLTNDAGICTVLQYERFPSDFYPFHNTLTTRYFTQLMHEGRWPSGAAVVMTSTTYSAVKHAIRRARIVNNSFRSTHPRNQGIHWIIWCSVFRKLDCRLLFMLLSGAQIVTIDLPFPLATTAGDASSSCDVIVAAFETVSFVTSGHVSDI